MKNSHLTEFLTDPTAKKFFLENDTAWEGVKKATFAYHMEKTEDKAHYFLSSLRFSHCAWCHRTREEVRFDDLSPECANHQEPLNIELTIYKEEMRYIKLLEKGKVFIPQFIEKNGITAESLAILHHTHGYDVETVGGIIDVPRNLIPKYDKLLELESARSISAHVKEVISVVM